MTYTHRPFQNDDDLVAIAQLVRRAFAHTPNWDSWNCARMDIWAQRRIAEYPRLELGKTPLAESPAATALYESAGLVEHHKIFSWMQQ